MKSLFSLRGNYGSSFTLSAISLRGKLSYTNSTLKTDSLLQSFHYELGMNYYSFCFSLYFELNDAQRLSVALQLLKQNDSSMRSILLGKELELIQKVATGQLDSPTKHRKLRVPPKIFELCLASQSQSQSVEISAVDFTFYELEVLIPGSMACKQKVVMSGRNGLLADLFRTARYSSTSLKQSKQLLESRVANVYDELGEEEFYRLFSKDVESTVLNYGRYYNHAAKYQISIDLVEQRLLQAIHRKQQATPCADIDTIDQNQNRFCLFDWLNNLMFRMSSRILLNEHQTKKNSLVSYYQELSSLRLTRLEKLILLVWLTEDEHIIPYIKAAEEMKLSFSLSDLQKTINSIKETFSEDFLLRVKLLLLNASSSFKVYRD